MAPVSLCFADRCLLLYDTYYNSYCIKAFTKQDKVEGWRQSAYAKFQLNVTCLSRIQIDLSSST